MESDLNDDQALWHRARATAELRRRRLIAIVGIALALALVLYGLGEFIANNGIYTRVQPIAFHGAAFVLLLSSVGLLAFHYAQYGSLFAVSLPEMPLASASQRTARGVTFNDFRVVERELRARDDALAERLSKLAAQLGERVDGAGGVGFSEGDRDQILKELRRTLVSEASASLIEEVRESLERQKRSRVEGLAAEQIAVTQSRLGAEIKSLVRTGNINLAFGTATTFAALFALAYFIFWNPVKFVDMVGLASHYFPRITLVIFIQAFALFFLKLYKATLADIKYYQNELTTIEGRAIGVALALHGGEDAGLNDAIAQQLRMERNRILEKGQSTVEIQRARITAARDRRLIDVLKAAVGKGRG
jgi:hypothetical protein